MPFFHSRSRNTRRLNLLDSPFLSSSSSSCGSNHHIHPLHPTDATSPAQPPQHLSTTTLNSINQHLESNTEEHPQPTPTYTPPPISEREHEETLVLTTAQSPEHAEYLEDVPVMGRVYRWLSSCQREGEDELESDDEQSQTPNPRHAHPRIPPRQNSHRGSSSPTPLPQTQILPTYESIQREETLNGPHRPNNLARHQPQTTTTTITNNNDNSPTHPPSRLSRRSTLTWSTDHNNNDTHHPPSPSFPSPSSPSAAAAAAETTDLQPRPYQRPAALSFRSAENRGETVFWMLVRSGAAARDRDLGALWAAATARLPP